VISMQQQNLTYTEIQRRISTPSEEDTST